MTAISLLAIGSAQISCVETEDDPPELANAAQESGGDIYEIIGASKEVKELFIIAGGVASATSGVGTAIAAVAVIKQFLDGFPSTEQQMLDKLDEIDRKLDVVIRLHQETYNSLVSQAVANCRGKIDLAAARLADWLRRRENGQPETAAHTQERVAALHEMMSSANVLLQQDYARRGVTTQMVYGPWWGIVPPLSTDPDQLVMRWDPQVSLPIVATAISVYLLARAADDPLFHRDGAHESELRLLATGLRNALATMESDLRCGTSTWPDYGNPGYTQYIAACANVLNGTYKKTMVVLPNGSQPYWGAWHAETKQELRAHMAMPEITALAAQLEAMAPPIDPVVVAGRFNNDARSDLALVGMGESTGVRVALSRSTNDGFDLVVPQVSPSDPMWSFQRWSLEKGVKVAAADFDGNGLTDIVLAGGGGWDRFRVAFANGDGTFRVTDAISYGPVDGATWQGFIRTPGVQLVATDLNDDGKADIAIAGGAGWGSIPVALSLGSSGSFWMQNDGAPDFPVWAAQTGATLLGGKFGGRSRALGSLALAGGSWWDTVPYARMPGNGSFGVMTPSVIENLWLQTFAIPARGSAYRDWKLVGDFDANGYDDIALVGSPNAPNSTVIAAYRQPTSIFQPEVVASARTASTPQLSNLLFGTIAVPVAGDFDGDGTSDIAVAGSASESLTFVTPAPTGVRSATWPSGGFQAWARQDQRGR